MYPEAYIQFLVHFHGDRDYFECHEILEEYWKKTGTEGKSSIWVGLILVSVSNYHYRRRNFEGAYRTLKKAISILQTKKQEAGLLGLNIDLLLVFLTDRLVHIHSENPYTSFNLPLSDLRLLQECQKTCRAKGFEWGMESDLLKTELIHRHQKRDRSEVIREREMAFEKRKKKKGKD